MSIKSNVYADAIYYQRKAAAYYHHARHMLEIGNAMSARDNQMAAAYYSAAARSILEVL